MASLTFQAKLRSSETREEMTEASTSSGGTLFFLGNGYDQLLTEDIEDLASELPPLKRFRKQNKFFVTDFSSQLWCEKQLELTLVCGKKHETTHMHRGSVRHTALEELDHESLLVEVDSREDVLGFTLLNTCILLDQLLDNGKAREVWVCGTLNGMLIRGIIDQLTLIPDHENSGSETQILITDTKTRWSKTEPSMAQKQTTRIQLQLYCWMLEQMAQGNIDFEILFSAYHCDPNLPFNAKELKPYETLWRITEHLTACCKKLPRIKQHMQVVYESEGVEFSTLIIPYSQTELSHELSSLMTWWTGSRQADGVLIAEKWKCRQCNFLNECTKTPLSKDEIEQVNLKQQQKLQEEEQQQEEQKRNFDVIDSSI